MNDIKIEKIQIGDKIIDQITDSEGNRWYPLKAFFRKILCKSEKVSSFRDSNMIRYMQVIEYTQDRQGGHRPIKTWCISENGIKFLLRNMRVNRTKNKKTYKAREKGFFEACLYFNVRTPEELDPLYINTPPKLDKYDIWSMICISNDTKINYATRWKRCKDCGYYYPDNVKYFGSNKRNSKSCLQCQNKNFKCQNKIIQYIYENDGLDLLYKLYEIKNDKEIVTELKNFINKGCVQKNDN